MKTWKLVSGIISIVLSVFVVFQSMIAGLANALEESGQVSGSAGLVVSICMLVEELYRLYLERIIQKEPTLHF